MRWIDMTKLLTGLSLAAGLVLTACSDDAAQSGTDAALKPDTSQSTWECDEHRGGWERCEEGWTLWCHALEKTGVTDLSHFHYISDCATRGYTCVEHGDNKASCVDTSTTCKPADVKCKDNAAQFCVKGMLAVERCGTAKECKEKDGIPSCEWKGDVCSGHGILYKGKCECSKGYVNHPTDTNACIPVGSKSDPCVLIAGTPTVTDVQEHFKDYFNSNAQMQTLYEVTLPDNKPTFLMFPVEVDGTYTIFLSKKGVLEAVMHRNGKDTTGLSEGTPPTACSTAIEDVWEAALSFDGKGCDVFVPYMMRFAAVPGGATFKLLLLQTK